MIPIPAPITQTDALLIQLDHCWFVGFSHLGLEQQQVLISLKVIFADTNLTESLTTAIDNILQGIYQPQYFRVIAAARAALQGAQYATLRQAIREGLKRPLTPDAPPALTTTPPEPLVNGTAHWLMDIALQGYARLDARTLSAFDTTLAQLQAIPERMPLSALLNGLIDSLAGAVPVTNADTAPLFRWGDLWSQAMLQTAAQPVVTAQPVSGTLYLMGAETRNQSRIFSVIFYGILDSTDGASWVRATFSAYKVSAIPEDELWFLLSTAQPLYEAFRTGKALTLDAMPCLPTGDLLWDDARATPAAAYAFHEIAKRYLAPNAPDALHIPAPLPEKQNLVHLAEPVLLDGYTLDDDHIAAGDLRLRFTPQRHDAGKEIPTLSKHSALVGLIRYDNQQLYLQPLAVAHGKKPPLLVDIKNTAKRFDAPAKNSAVLMLRERASRLLREKQGTKTTP